MAEPQYTKGNRCRNKEELQPVNRVTPRWKSLVGGVYGPNPVQVQLEKYPPIKDTIKATPSKHARMIPAIFRGFFTFFQNERNHDTVASPLSERQLYNNPSCCAPF